MALDKLKKRMPAPNEDMEMEEVDLMEMEDEEEMPEEAMSNFADLSDDELMEAIDEAKKRGLLENEEEVSEEEMELPEE